VASTQYEANRTTRTVKCSWHWSQELYTSYEYFRFSRRRIWSWLFLDVASCSLIEIDRRFRCIFTVSNIISLMMEAVRTYETSQKTLNFTLQFWLKSYSNNGYFMRTLTWMSAREKKIQSGKSPRGNSPRKLSATLGNTPRNISCFSYHSDRHQTPFLLEVIDCG
jgi:hypothetical protein